MQGASLDMVSDLLGHSDIQVTKEFHARWDSDELGTIHNKYSWLNKFGEMMNDDIPSSEECTLN